MAYLGYFKHKMNAFQPTPGAITDLSFSCIELVYLVYLLRLRGKTADCYLIILIYATALPMQLASFMLGSWDEPATIWFWQLFIFEGLQGLAVIGCSYRFYKNPYPRESKIVCLIYLILFTFAICFWFKDYYRDNHIDREHILFPIVLMTAATSWSGINYLRKIRLYPGAREVALFRGFALSVLIYTLLEGLNICTVMAWITTVPYMILLYLCSLSLTVLVGFAYFNYAREKTAFGTKMVGVTLLLTLGVTGLVPVILFGPAGTPGTAPYTRMFLWIIPGLTLLIAVFLPLLLRLTLLRPLDKIVVAVKQVSAGDLDARIDLDLNDEIGQLSQHFNQMTGSLRERTEQLDSMRERIATDFHDQTGNMLSAITRQAGLLKLKLGREHELQPMIKSIVDNSNSLYASSKDFLWQLNHDSDDPGELFAYLTAHGQQYYNQFDIAFSSRAEDCGPAKFDPSSALNLIFIFKEAMTNVVKHAGASEVTLTLAYAPAAIAYTLTDNGTWKEADPAQEHYGLSNMERRCKKNNFGYTLTKAPAGTRIVISVPFINERS